MHDGRELHAAIEVVARGGSMIDPEMVRLLLESEERGTTRRSRELTPREREVLAAMAAGKSNAAIAEELVLTKRAVEKHVGAIFLKLGLPDEDQVSRRVAAVLLYLGEHDQRPLQTPRRTGGGARRRCRVCLGAPSHPPVPRSSIFRVRADAP